MCYEIILTDRCNRKCKFCYINQSGYTETTENINRFIDEVRRRQKDVVDSFDIHIFGGEPFLNYDGVKLVYDAFIDDPRAKVHIFSNGDLITEDKAVRLGRAMLHMTAYSIFNPESHNRYSRIYNMFNWCSCSYTLTGNDIMRFDELEDIFKGLGFKYRLHLSHDPYSWSSFNVERLYDIIYGIAMKKLDEYSQRFTNQEPRVDGFVEPYVARYVQSMIDGNMKQNFCVNDDKKTFYKGRFVGPCIRIGDIEMKYDGTRCKGCDYELICTKGCFAELKPDVDIRLCTLEKARFDAVKDFFDRNLPNIERILDFYIKFAKIN